jgi:prolyl oligopeptidase
MTPPRTRREPVVDSLHGVDVPDPYRWLERGDDPEVQQWVAEQNSLTRSALDAIPARDTWHERLVALMGLPLVQGVAVRGDRLFLLEREAGAQQARLVVRSLAEPGAGVTVLADPAAGTADAASAVDWFYPSRDGSLVAFGVSEGGTENSVLRIARTDDGSLLADEIPNCRACSLSWEPGDAAFCYSRYPEGEEYERTIHRHVLGGDWRHDPVLWDARITQQTWPNVTVSTTGRFVLIEAMVGWRRSDLHLLDRGTDGTGTTWTTILEGVDALNDGWRFTTDDAALVGTTTLDASLGRVVRVDLDADDLSPSAWHTVVPEGDAVLGAPQFVPDGFYLPSTLVGVDRLEHVGHDGTRRPVEGLGLVALAGLATDDDTGAAVAIVNGFDTPAGAWLVSGGAPEMLHPVVDRSLVPDLAVSQVEYPSLDGTQVPMFLVHRADVTPTSDTPAILNGYGGFSIIETPVWSPTIAAWCATGGLYAIAGLRGGAEYGEAWHEAGRRGNKQNVFDDFAAAADWLVATGRTSRERLAIAGGSNGGLLVGAALTQRPDLCRAVWCAVPLLDMVRFPRFLIAKLWTDEYGDPDVAEEFGWLHAYSPYHRVREGERYPAVLITTAEGDTRVDPLHARKMAAMLQWAVTDVPDARPALLHQEGRAGHGVGKPVGKRAAEQADVLAFFSWQLGHDL